MQKTSMLPVILLAVFVGFVITGVAIQYYDIAFNDRSQAAERTAEIGHGSSETGTELDTMMNELKGTVITKNGTALEISMDLDPFVNGEAEYGVRAVQFKEGTISARVIDPSGNQLVSRIIDAESVRGQFQVSSPGVHTLVIENSGEKSEVGGSILHFSYVIGVLPIYLVISGSIGVVAVGASILLWRYMRPSSD